MTDEERIKKIRSQTTVDMYDIEFLMEKYKGLVRSISRRFYIAGADAEDVAQEGMIGLYNSIRTFEPDKNVPFSLFAAMCIERQIKTAVTASNRRKQTPLNGAVSLETTVSVDEEGEDLHLYDVMPDNNATSPEDTMVEKLTWNDYLEKLTAVLSKMEKKVLDLFLQGLDYKEIAEKLSISEKAADNALQRIRRKASAIASSGSDTDRSRKV